MPRSEPRLQLDPAIFNLIEAAATARKMTKRQFVEYAVQHTIFSREATEQLIQLVASGNEHLPVLFGQIAGIRDFIADRYDFDFDRAGRADDTGN